MKGFRTLATNAGFGAIFAFLISFDWESAGVPEQEATWIVGGLGLANVVLNVILRFKTDTPVGRKA